MKNKVSGLQKELSETKEMKSQLEHQKVEWKRELCSLRMDAHHSYMLQGKKKQKIIEFLLNKGADINAVDNFGSSALAHAACYDSADTVHVLLRHGIDCSSEDVFGRAADQFAHHRGFIKNQKIILAYKSKKDKENKKNEKNRKEEKKKNDKKKEENDLAKMNAHKDTEKRRPMKLNFEDSCATLSESIDFETKVMCALVKFSALNLVSIFYLCVAFIHELLPQWFTLSFLKEAEFINSFFNVYWGKFDL
ncbi:ankyrin repeat domain-containing protein 18B-like isoform X1 [Talpa occidentalis]|uniref:ankyrin repeat domain-containing protein 18B-like isoform X1 n=1 Tax=Talpa occidentalis TaxID=50954 RepID=UPI0023F63EAE|nr:ankyrin repeat domain-containing protein 18B-like isoform X1 [Talpa occidentalis]